MFRQRLIVIAAIAVALLGLFTLAVGAAAAPSGKPRETIKADFSGGATPPAIICPGPDGADACPLPPPPPPPPPTPPPPPPPPACSDGWDNDGDTYVDAGGDVGCLGNPWGTSEDDYNTWASGSEVDGGGANYGWLSGDARGTCWQRESARTRGKLTYTRRLYLLTTWCARFGTTISYRLSSVRTHHDSFCWNTSPPVSQKTAGGTGWSWVDVQAWVEIECASVPSYWPKYHDTLMMRMRYLPDGRVVRLAYE